jgi:DNA-binding PadR family transcriptional regulator
VSIKARTGSLSPEYTLLGFLVGGPDHGYNLHRRCQTELGQIWHLSQSQAYAILKRLEMRGDIAVSRKKQSKRPDRQMLSITPLGQRRFETWLEGRAGTTARSIRLEFLTKLYFAVRYSPHLVPIVQDRQREDLEGRIARLEDLLHQTPGEQIFNRISLGLRLKQMKLIQEWLKEIEDQVGRGTEQPG